MSSTYLPYCVALALPLLMVSDAHADGMRCGNRLVSTGDSLYEVESRCGTPADKQRRTELRNERVWVGGPCTVPNQIQCGRVIERTVEITIDEWIYDFGPQQLIKRLTFEQGRLWAVTTGSYGMKRE